MLASMSMYLGVILSLFTLFGVAFALSLIGVLAFSPVDIISCFLVFIGVSLLSSYIFAYLFSVRAHHLSAIITGSILFFLFSPVATVSNLLLYSLIALIAIASKYLLVWRGRHLFNPVAIAAALISITGLQAASWWGASFSLAIPATLFGLIILYKTQRLLMGFIFLGVYIGALLASVMVQGQSIETVSLSLVAWWPLFFVGFMLSEPQTLPSRRFQYLIVSAFVAFLIAFHPMLGPVYLTPEIALVAGNLLSFVFTRRVGIKLRLVNRTKHAGDQEVFEFKPTRPFHFLPGQYAEIMVPHKTTDLRGERRSFTIASAPAAKTIVIATRYAEMSSTFKKHFRMLKNGDEISATAVRGDFLLPKDSKIKLLFIAGGIGITPFHAFLQALQLKGEHRDITIIYAVRSVKEVLFKESLYRTEHGPRVIIVAPDAPLHHSEMIRATFISYDMLKNNVKDISGRHVYISGAPQMVMSLKKVAKRLGVKHITTDDFTGY